MDRARLEPDHFVFPACEGGKVDPIRPQKTWRTGWRQIARASGLRGFRFHDLRHHAITELAESQASDQTIMAIAGHVSHQMLEHYSHVRLEAKREALDALATRKPELARQERLDGSYVTKHVTIKPQEARPQPLSRTKKWSGREDLNLRPPGPEPGALPG